ncbi:MAG: protoporphyrinogen oxidase HemJ [Pseudomonadota bacterium]
MDSSVDWALWTKAIHVIAIIAWMAGLLYLPRLFVYHAKAAIGSELSETFKIMEYRLLKIIMNPAMIVAWIFGLLLAYKQNQFSDPWLHAKITLVVLLSIFHMVLGKWRKDFFADKNTKSENFYRYINEIPTVLMIGVIILVVVKPF